MQAPRNHRSLPSIGLALGLALGLSASTPAAALAAATEPPASTEEPAKGSDPADEAEAERLEGLFNSARTLYEEGQYEAAIAAFESAYRVSPEPNLLYNIFVCYERLDRPEEALEALDRYAEVAPAEDQDQIARDRRRLQALADRKEEEEAAGAAAAAGGGEQNAPTRTGESEPAQPSDTGPRDPKDRIYGPPAWALTAVTGVALGVGIGFGINSSNLANDAQDECASGADPVCPRSAESSMETARNRGIVADVSFGVAGVAAIALIAVVAAKAAKRKRSKAAASLTPYGSPRGAGLQFRARF